MWVKIFSFFKDNRAKGPFPTFTCFEYLNILLCLYSREFLSKCRKIQYGHKEDEEDANVSDQPAERQELWLWQGKYIYQFRQYLK